jgi:hypothetical protein
MPLVPRIHTAEWHIGASACVYPQAMILGLRRRILRTEIGRIGVAHADEDHKIIDLEVDY